MPPSACPLGLRASVCIDPTNIIAWSTTRLSTRDSHANDKTHACNANCGQFYVIELRPESPRGGLNTNQGFVELGSLQVKRLRRSPVIAMYPWGVPETPKPNISPPREKRDPLKLARYYKSLLDSGKFENRAALVRFLGVSRARVTHVLKRLTSK